MTFFVAELDKIVNKEFELFLLIERSSRWGTFTELQTQENKPIISIPTNCSWHTLLRLSPHLRYCLHSFKLFCRYLF